MLRHPSFSKSSIMKVLVFHASPPGVSMSKTMASAPSSVARFMARDMNSKRAGFIKSSSPTGMITTLPVKSPFLSGLLASGRFGFGAGTTGLGASASLKVSGTSGFFGEGGS
jgi:hypothetical protein